MSVLAVKKAIRKSYKSLNLIINKDGDDYVAIIQTPFGLTSEAKLTTGENDKHLTGTWCDVRSGVGAIRPMHIVQFNLNTYLDDNYADMTNVEVVAHIGDERITTHFVELGAELDVWSTLTPEDDDSWMEIMSLDDVFNKADKPRCQMIDIIEKQLRESEYEDGALCISVPDKYREELGVYMNQFNKRNDKEWYMCEVDYEDGKVRVSVKREYKQPVLVPKFL